MSYADVAAKGPKQSAHEAAAPRPPEIVANQTASTASLVDVDSPSVHTVPSDFLDQDVTTKTQSDRLQREADAAKAKADAAAKKPAARARKPDSWLARRCDSLSPASADALSAANLAVVVSASSYLGYKAWHLYDRGNLDWKTAGLGLAILAAIGAVHTIVGGYLCKAKKKDSS